MVRIYKSTQFQSTEDQQSDSDLQLVTESQAPAEPGEAEPAEPAEPPPPAVVFEPGDIVGPLGGVLRRRKRYMEQHYGDLDDQKPTFPGSNSAVLY